LFSRRIRAGQQRQASDQGPQRQEFTNGSLKLPNARAKQTRLVDQRLPNQPPCVCACSHDTHPPFASFRIADEFNGCFPFAAQSRDTPHGSRTGTLLFPILS
jgi:hypothetical protein